MRQQLQQIEQIYQKQSFFSTTEIRLLTDSQKNVLHSWKYAIDYQIQSSKFNFQIPPNPAAYQRQLFFKGVKAHGKDIWSMCAKFRGS